MRGELLDAVFSADRDAGGDGGLDRFISLGLGGGAQGDCCRVPAGGNGGPLHTGLDIPDMAGNFG